MPLPATPRQRRLLLGCVAVPVTLIGSMLGATTASAAGSTETTKAGLVAAFQAATNGYVVTLGNDLLGDGGTSDVLTVPDNRSVTLDLNGHRLEVDSVSIGSPSYLRIKDSTGTGADIAIGKSSVAPTENVATGVKFSSGSRFEIESAVRLTSTGSDGRAGIGSVLGSTSPGFFYIDDGATVDATGGTHGAGIGAGEGAVPLSTISIGNATVTATGGTGAAAIGGGFGSTGAGSAVSIQNGDVTLAGTTAATFSSLENVATTGGTSTLRVASGSTLTIPSGQTVRNTGDLVVDGTVTGAGTIDNPGGTIRQGPGGVVDDGGLTVTGRNHAVSFAAAGGTVTAPATKHVYATTFANAGLDLAAYTGTSGSRSLVGWSGTQSNTVVAPVTNDDLLAALSTAGGESDPVALTAVYETPIAFSSTMLPNAATDQRYDRQAPVTGDATTFAVAGDPAGGLPAGTIPAFPAGLAIDGTTGAITGRPTTSGHYSFVLTASSPYQRRSQVLTIDVAGAPVIATTALPDAMAGTAYSAPILATSESGAITYAVSGGVLPGGLLVDPSTGVLAGTPTSTGTFTFTLAATNAFGTVERTLSLTVAAATVTPPTGGSATGGSNGTGAPPANGSPVVSAPVAAPVLPILPTTTVKLGHPLALSVAGNSTVPVTYSVPAKDLPAGISLDRSAGLLFGAPRVAGRSVLHITARNSAGSGTRAYIVVVPAATHLVTASASAITPRSGAKVVITIRGVRAGERWRVSVNGHQLRTGVARFGGTIKAAVRLPAQAKDTKHRIRVAADRRITDPSTVAVHELTVTAVTPTKTLRLTRSGSTLTVRGLAAKERVTITRGKTVLVTGRADAHGVFVARRSHLKPGTHTVTGSTKQRTGRLVVR
jgi:hypothetical protein